MDTIGALGALGPQGPEATDGAFKQWSLQRLLVTLALLNSIQRLQNNRHIKERNTEATQTIHQRQILTRKSTRNNTEAKDPIRGWY